MKIKPGRSHLDLDSVSQDCVWFFGHPLFFHHFPDSKMSYTSIPDLEPLSVKGIDSTADVLELTIPRREKRAAFEQGDASEMIEEETSSEEEREVGGHDDAPFSEIEKTPIIMKLTVYEKFRELAASFTVTRDCDVLTFRGL